MATQFAATFVNPQVNNYPVTEKHDNVFFASQCPFMLPFKEGFKTVALPKHENSMTNLFGLIYDRKLHKFHDLKKALQNASRSKVFAFTLHGYDTDTVMDYCELEFASLGFPVHYRVTQLPECFDLLFDYDKTNEFSGNGSAAITPVAPFIRCLVEVSKSDKFKSKEPLLNKSVSEVVYGDYQEYYNLFNFYHINK
jgi:hypothetical protein